MEGEARAGGDAGEEDSAGGGGDGGAAFEGGQGGLEDVDGTDEVGVVVGEEVVGGEAVEGLEVDQAGKVGEAVKNFKKPKKKTL